MQMALIAPSSMLSLNTRTAISLVLPRLLQTKDQISHFRNTGSYKILDNGAAEGELTDFNKLLQMAIEIAADEVVLPDVLSNCAETMTLAVKTAEACKRHPRFKYMGVIQGYSVTEMMKCLDVFASLEHITAVGIPRITAEALRMTYIRSDMARAITERYPGRFEIHCLGSTRWTHEPEALSLIPEIRSMDTSLPIYLGMQGISIDKCGKETTARPKGFFEYDKPSDQQWELINRNARIYLSWGDPTTSLSDLRELFPVYGGDEVLP